MEDTMIEMDVANPLSMLSAYLTVMATTNPPKAWKIIFHDIVYKIYIIIFPLLGRGLNLLPNKRAQTPPGPPPPKWTFVEFLGTRALTPEQTKLNDWFARFPVDIQGGQSKVGTDSFKYNFFCDQTIFKNLILK
jgi:hypothetical protein